MSLNKKNLVIIIILAVVILATVAYVSYRKMSAPSETNRDELLKQIPNTSGPAKITEAEREAELAKIKNTSGPVKITETERLKQLQAIPPSTTTKK